MRSEQFYSGFWVIWLENEFLPGKMTKQHPRFESTSVNFAVLVKSGVRGPPPSWRPVCPHSGSVAVALFTSDQGVRGCTAPRCDQRSSWLAALHLPCPSPLHGDLIPPPPPPLCAHASSKPTSAEGGMSATRRASSLDTSPASLGLGRGSGGCLEGLVRRRLGGQRALHRSCLRDGGLRLTGKGGHITTARSGSWARLM